jgi:hypothetical protein
MCVLLRHVKGQSVGANRHAPRFSIERAGLQSHQRRWPLVGRCRKVSRMPTMFNRTQSLDDVVNAENAFKEARAACNRGDHFAALPLFRLAAEQGNAEAQYALGLIYINGRGTPTDFIEAAHWFRRGAEQGDMDSLYMLGCCYDEGWGVQKNDVQAYAWLSLAAALGYERAIEELARVSTRMTPAQIAEAEKFARDTGIQAITPPCDRAPR